jgi:hypothetical protein
MIFLYHIKMTYSPLAFNINRKTLHYNEIYNKNHRRFCQRFIDTIVLNHHKLIIDLTRKYNVDSCMFHYATVDTDIFLWKIRDILDNFMNYTTVKQAIYSTETIAAVENLFIEIQKIKNEWINVFKN